MPIYFVGAPGAVKIGSTIVHGPNGIVSRLKSLQTGNPYRLQLFGVVPGTRQLELALHRQFAELRMTGEWFRYEGRLKALVESLTSFPYSLLGADDPILALRHRDAPDTVYQVFVQAGGIEWWCFKNYADSTMGEDPIARQAAVKNPTPTLRGVVRDLVGYRADPDYTMVPKLIERAKELAA